MDYVISDLHFNDKGVIRFERTEFSTTEEHDAFLIKQWNKTVVNKDDRVFFLGDLCDNSGKRATVDAVKALVSQLRGHKIIILGNHDHFKMEEYKEMGFEQVIAGPYYYKPYIILSHEPCREAFNNPYVYNIHGHLHNAKLELDNYICVSAKHINYKPMKLGKLTLKIAAKVKTRKESFMEEWYAEYYNFMKYKLYYAEDGRIDSTKTLSMKEPKDR